MAQPPFSGTPSHHACELVDGLHDATITVTQAVLPVLEVSATGWTSTSGWHDIELVVLRMVHYDDDLEQPSLPAIAFGLMGKPPTGRWAKRHALPNPLRVHAGIRLPLLDMLPTDTVTVAAATTMQTRAIAPDVLGTWHDMLRDRLRDGLHARLTGRRLDPRVLRCRESRLACGFPEGTRVMKEGEAQPIDLDPGRFNVIVDRNFCVRDVWFD